jgi:hypothetical protein
MPRILLTPKPGISVSAHVTDGEITPETLKALVSVATAAAEHAEAENRYTKGRDFNGEA